MPLSESPPPPVELTRESEWREGQPPVSTPRGEPPALKHFGVGQLAPTPAAATAPFWPAYSHSSSACTIAASKLLPPSDATLPCWYAVRATIGAPPLRGDIASACWMGVAASCCRGWLSAICCCCC